MNLRLFSGLLAVGLVWLVPAALAQTSGPAPVVIDPAKCIIVPADETNPIISYAVGELQTHLKLVTGVNIPAGKSSSTNQFPIHVGSRPSDDQSAFASEEARWRITPKGIWLYGKDQINGSKESASGYVDTRKSVTHPALASRNQAGTLFAVYEFLETALGIRWIEPGSAGIVYRASSPLKISTGQGQWIPQFSQRHLRAAYEDNLRTRALEEGVGPKDLQFTPEEFAARQYDEAVWMRRMRRGKTITFGYGHAFTKWWDQYGKTHPEYFALSRKGKREPVSAKAAERVKMCVSSEALVKQVVADHYARGGGKVINACENDSREFCRCEKCLALDVRLPGEEALDVDDAVLTDRYVHFTNAVLREARKRDPEVQVVFYAYSRYNFPPRRERLDDGIITFLLPNSGMTLEQTKTYYESWKAANAKEAYLRPNDLNQDTGISLGFEEQFFAKFKMADSHLKLKGTDYDTCYGFWSISGIANYILSRGFYRPDRSFEDWEDEYANAHGKAAEEVKAYHRYWRQVWNERVMKNQASLETYSAGIKLLRNRVANLVDLIYSDADFDRTDAILAKALAKDLAPDDRRRVQTLVLANQHNRLTYLATKANRLASDASAEERKQSTQTLYDFRRKHRTDLNMNWELLHWIENIYGDNAGFFRLLDSEPEVLKKLRIKDDAAIRAARASNPAPLW